MAKRGRKPKPRALKLVEGNAGKREIPDDELPTTGEPTPPDFVLRDADAMARWDDYAPRLIELGVLGENDSDNFGMWCWLMAEFARYPAGFSASKISQVRALASSFGMDPSSRTRLPGKPKKDEEDPAGKYFGS